MELRPFDSVTLTQQLAAKLMGVEKISEVCLVQCVCFNASLMLISTKKTLFFKGNCERTASEIRRQSVRVRRDGAKCQVVAWLCY